MLLYPSEIYFSQDSINRSFDRNCHHKFKPIGETLDELITKRITVSEIPRISVVQKDGKWISADNRRLWVFRKFEELGSNERIPVNPTNYIPPSKCTSNNGGESVLVRGNPGGRKWRSMTISKPRRIERNTTITDSSHIQTAISPELINIKSPPQQSTSLGCFFGTSTVNASSTSTGVIPPSFGASDQTKSESHPQLQAAISCIFARNLTYCEIPIPSIFMQRLDPETIRYSKEKITVSLDKIKPFLHDPINVYKVREEHWVTDGNKRLYVYKQQRRLVPDLRINANVKEDMDEFLEKMREEQPWISLMEVIQLGENISVEF